MVASGRSYGKRWGCVQTKLYGRGNGRVVRMERHVIRMGKAVIQRDVLHAVGYKWKCSIMQPQTYKYEFMR